MTSKNKECTFVQENIAWGRALSQLDQDHILSCSKCSVVAMEFEEIDSVIKNAEAFVPQGFADKVMEKVMVHEKLQNSLYIDLKDFFMMLFNNQILRWGIGGTSFLLAFSAH
jgi:hypothetical protein